MKREVGDNVYSGDGWKKGEKRGRMMRKQLSKIEVKFESNEEEGKEGEVEESMKHEGGTTGLKVAKFNASIPSWNLKQQSR